MQLIFCPLVPFFPRISSFLLSRMITCRLTRSLARPATPSHQHLCFPLYRPGYISTLSTRRLSILSHGVSRPLSPAPAPASIRFYSVISPTLQRVHGKKNGEKWPWLEMESPATHPRLIPLFSRKSSVAPRSESPLAHVTRGECGWIKPRVSTNDRTISLTRLRLFSTALSVVAHARQSTRSGRRFDKYHGTTAHF